MSVAIDDLCRAMSYEVEPTSRSCAAPFDGWPDYEKHHWRCGMQQALKALHAAPVSTLEITRIKAAVPLVDERTIYEVARSLIALRTGLA